MVILCAHSLWEDKGRCNRSRSPSPEDSEHPKCWHGLLSVAAPALLTSTTWKASVKRGKRPPHAHCQDGIPAPLTLAVKHDPGYEKKLFPISVKDNFLHL